MSRPALGRGGVRNSPQSLRGRGRGTPIHHNAVHESHITTVGVRRPGYGKTGKPMQVTANYFKTTIPEDVIHHYDGSFCRVRFDSQN
jgi:eukaryotic translation initiation factor 2C